MTKTYVTLSGTPKKYKGVPFKGTSKNNIIKTKIKCITCFTWSSFFTKAFRLVSWGIIVQRLGANLPITGG